MSRAPLAAGQGVSLLSTQRRWTRVRIAILSVLLFLGTGLVLRRAFELQVQRAPALREMARAQYLRDIRLAPKRGSIYDRHGAELAVSVDVDSVWANPREVRAKHGAPARIAAELSRVLGSDPQRLVARLSSRRYFVWIERRVTPKQAAAIRALALPGVYLTRESRRYYPNRELAAHVLGFANVDGVGIEGLELAFETQLRGSTRVVPAIRDRRGAVVFSEQLFDDRASQGDDLTLTIDKTIQHIAERELGLAVRTFEARGGSVVVMDPRTGEVLAMASAPTYNLNDPSGAAPAHRRNRAVTDRFEPGSTVKPFTVAAALASGTIGASQPIACENGAMKIAEYTIHDSQAFDKLTPAQILTYSSNIGTAKIGATLGRRGLFRALRRFGFGEATDLGLPGETQGILRHYRRWYEMDAATISFGQGMSVTTIQLATAMSTIANGGRLMKPILVKRVSNSRGETVEEALPRVQRQVIPSWAARQVTDMMTAVTSDGGTGVEAAIDGYVVAGKTGTAQKADYVAGGYAVDRWLASFAGFVPADEPRLVIVVIIDEPVIAHYGGAVAGPVFRRIGQSALRHLGVPARGQARSLASAPKAKRVPKVVRPEPAFTLGSTGSGQRVVPDLSGLTARAALLRLHRSGLLARIEGTGIVVSQLPAAGSAAPSGAAVHLTLARPDPSESADPEPRPADPGTLAHAAGAAPRVPR